jgi:small-conductance mechanosensitive channel
LALILLLVASGTGLTFGLGVLSTEPNNDGFYSTGSVAALAAMAIVVAAGIRLTLGGERSLAGAVALGVLFFAALLTVFVVGVFAPYAAGWGSRELEDFGGEDMSWQTWLSSLLIGAAAAGTLLGAFIGLLSWAARFTRPRHG